MRSLNHLVKKDNQKKTNKKSKSSEKNIKKDKTSKKSKSKTKRNKDSRKPKEEETDHFIETFTSKLVDPNLNKYKNNFLNSENNKKIADFKAANEEDDDQNYQKIMD